MRLKVRHRRQPRGDANDRGGARGGHSSCHPVIKTKIAPLGETFKWGVCDKGSDEACVAGRREEQA